MITMISSFFILMIGPSAMANFNLANNGKVVICYADDNQSWVINAQRTAIKYTVEGESSGSKKILKRNSDEETFVTYTTSEGTLALNDYGDSFQFKGDIDAGQIRCK